MKTILFMTAAPNISNSTKNQTSCFQYKLHHLEYKIKRKQRQQDSDMTLITQAKKHISSSKVQDWTQQVMKLQVMKKILVLNNSNIFLGKIHLKEDKESGIINSILEHLCRFWSSMSRYLVTQVKFSKFSALYLRKKNSKLLKWNRLLQLQSIKNLFP